MLKLKSEYIFIDHYIDIFNTMKCLFLFLFIFFVCWFIGCLFIAIRNEHLHQKGTKRLNKYLKNL